MPAIPDIDRCIQTYLHQGVFSAAACVASVGNRVFHRAFYGASQAGTGAGARAQLREDALFDLASLTKPLATALAAMHLVSRGRLDLGAALNRTIPELRDARFGAITVDMLLDHTAGFPATRSFWDVLRQTDAKVVGTRGALPQIRKLVAETPLEHDPGTKACYSDVGFMLLGWIVEAAAGKPLDILLERELYAALGLSPDLLFVRLDDAKQKAKLARRQFVATEDCPWREKVLVGEVHDPNAWAMGGVAGHAGLFGTADAVWKLCYALWHSAQGDGREFLGGTVRRFWTRSRRVRDTTRTLGWDTPSARGSMAGDRFSRTSVGHLGFTGTSIWIDLSTDIIGVLLTNSVHPKVEGKSEALKSLRPKVYDLIAKYGEALPRDPDRPTGAQAFSKTKLS